MSRKTKKERDEEFAKWAASEEGRAFTTWWKHHRYSGYGVNPVGRQRWGILPYEAWQIWKYKAEFYVEHEEQLLWPEDLDKPNFEDIQKWVSEQHLTEERTAALEERLGPEFWRRMTPEVWYSNFKAITRELVVYQNSFTKEFDALVGHITKSMKDKMEDTYAYEHGQSAEETEALRRRRE